MSREKCSGQGTVRSGQKNRKRETENRETGKQGTVVGGKYHGDIMMTIELSKQSRADAVASIQRYFREEMPEPIGELPAGLLLNFILEEIGPAIYNKAIADAQARLLGRVSDLNGELYADEFQYWIRLENKRKNRR